MSELEPTPELPDKTPTHEVRFPTRINKRGADISGECRYDADHLLGIYSQVVYNTTTGGISGSASSNVARRSYCAWATFGFCPNLPSLVSYSTAPIQVSRVPAHVSSIDAIADAENSAPRSLT